MTHNDFPKDTVCDKKQWYSSGVRHLILCTTLFWILCFMLCMWTTSAVMPQGGRMSPAIPLSIVLGKDSDRSADSMPGRKQAYIPPSSLLYSSRSVAHAFLWTSEMQFCPILTSAAEDWLPIPHSCWSGAVLYGNAQSSISDIST